MGSFEFRSDKIPSTPPDGRIPPRIETQLSSRAAINHAHQYFHATGAEAHALAQPPLVPGASEPVSPLIQMIMRLPGHIGIFNSFFEALQALILPHLDFLPHLDPSLFAAHAHDAANSALSSITEHVRIDLGVLPADAHIFDGLQMNSATSGLGHMNLHLSDAELSQHALQVSGTPDLGKPLYEGAGSPSGGGTAGGGDGMLAGPALSDHGAANHLAGAHRIFSHSLFERPGSGMNNPLTASTQAPNNVQASPTTSLSSAVHVQNNNLNVSGSPFARPAALPAQGEAGMGGVADQSSLNAGFHAGVPTERALAGGTLGPSGAVSDQLGARHLLASNDQGVETFRPTLGGDSSSYDASSLQDPSGGTTPLKGLRAKELSLDGGGKPTHGTGSSPNFRSVSGDLNSNSHGRLIQVHKPLSDVKDHIAHRTNSPAYSKSHHIATLPKHSLDHGLKAIKTPVAKDTIASTQTSDTAGAATTDQPSSYTIRSGDCLWNIAKRQLGDATRWQEIYKLNADRLGSNPDLIYAGTDIQLPNASQDLASHGLTAGKYVVRAGDNLWNISKDFLGSGEKWGQLYHMNTDVIGANPRLILPGQELTISNPSDVVASNGAAPISESTGLVSTQAPVNNHMAEAITTPQNSIPEATPAPAMSDAPAPVSGNASLGAPVLPAQNGPLSGPGGAQAATPALSQNVQTDPASDPNVVSPSLAPDLSFLNQPKR